MPIVRDIPGYKAVYRGNVLLWKSNLQITARVLYVLAGAIIVLWKNSSDATVFNEMSRSGKRFILTQDGVSELVRRDFRERYGRRFELMNYGAEGVFAEDEDILITLED